jgi:hypothetical protein
MQTTVEQACSAMWLIVATRPRDFRPSLPVAEQFHATFGGEAIDPIWQAGRTPRCRFGLWSLFAAIASG